MAVGSENLHSTPKNEGIRSATDTPPHRHQETAVPSRHGTEPLQTLRAHRHPPPRRLLPPHRHHRHHRHPQLLLLRRAPPPPRSRHPGGGGEGEVRGADVGAVRARRPPGPAAELLAGGVRGGVRGARRGRRRFQGGRRLRDREDVDGDEVSAGSGIFIFEKIRCGGECCQGETASNPRPHKGDIVIHGIVGNSITSFLEPENPCMTGGVSCLRHGR